MGRPPAGRLLAQIPIIQFPGFDLHAGIVTLDGKVTGFEFGIIVGHDQLVIDPKLNVLADGPDAVAKPLAVLGEEFGRFSGGLAGFPQPPGIGILAVTNLGFVAPWKTIHIVGRRIGAKIQPAVRLGALLGDFIWLFGLTLVSRTFAERLNRPRVWMLIDLSTIILVAIILIKMISYFLS